MALQPRLNRLLALFIQPSLLSSNTLKTPIELKTTANIRFSWLRMQSVTTVEIAAIRAVGVETALSSCVLTLQEIIHWWVHVATCIHYRLYRPGRHCFQPVFRQLSARVESAEHPCQVR